MWVEHVGFFLIASPYDLSRLAFPHTISPLFRFWVHLDPKTSHEDAHIWIRQVNFTQGLSKSKRHVKVDKTGSSQIGLFDDFGCVGGMSYTVIESPQQEQDEFLKNLDLESRSYSLSTLPPSIALQSQAANAMLRELENEEKKVVISIEKVLIDPQVILSVPV